MIKSISTALTTSLFALAALPAAAQDANLCAGTGANGQWLGGDEASSDISTSDNYLEQMALVLMRNEYVGLFTVSEAGEYRIEAAGRGGGDTVLDLRNAAGEIVISDDDSGGDASSRAETYLESGTYCASMRSFGGAPLTGFVRVGRMDQDTLTPGINTVPPVMPNDTEGCDIEAAQPLMLNSPMTYPWDVNHQYRLTLDAATPLSLTAENELADPVLVLYDDQGNWIAENDDYDGLNSRIDMVNPLAAGDYCVMLDLYGDSSQPITVTATEYDPAAAQLALYNRGEASPPLDGSYPVQSLGELAFRSREDAMISGDAKWYSLEIFDGGIVLVEAIAQGQGDPVLRMFDDLGREIGYNDDANGTLDSMLTVRVQPGTYLVAVRQLDNSTQGMIRMVFERYVPARP